MENWGFKKIANLDIYIMLTQCTHESKNAFRRKTKEFGEVSKYFIHKIVTTDVKRNVWL